jgi:hypothetical protein
VPFKVKAVGAGLLLVHEPLNPNDAVPLVATEPLYPAFFAVTCAPLWLTVALQACVTFWPAE